jgi:hypothetical protein
MQRAETSDSAARRSEGGVPVSDGRPTRRLSERVVIDQLLDEVRQILEGHPESRERRTLLGKLQRLDSAVARWTAFPPNSDQVSAMRDVLDALHQEVSRTGL